MKNNKTTMTRKEDVQRGWYVLDADGKILGRIAVQIAFRLQGKHKPCYTPHVDNGDNIVVVNAEKVRVTGKKAEQKVYRHHTGYVGGLKERSYSEMMKRHPDRIIRLAVARMMPKTKLGRKMLKKLHIYAGQVHPHTGQKPETFELEIS